ncbi:MAG TPA: sialate O-acetylesterase [Candidatus Kapabacteria bacterium]|nr:sialate O-acetylesterase [Candidatus Kapabacteria bacterium]
MKNRTLFLITLVCVIYYPLSSFGQLPSSPKLWLRSDTGIVTNGLNLVSWGDVRDTTKKFFVPAGQGSPNYFAGNFNGRPSVSFDGLLAFLEGPPIYPTSEDYTIFIVCKVSDFTKTNNIFSGTSGHAIWLSGTRYPNVFHGNFSNVTSSGIAFGDTAMMLEVKFDQATQIASIRINDEDADSNFIGVNTDSTLFIGAYAAGNLFAGSIAEIIMYNRYLHSIEQDSIEHYLENRYGIAGPKPVPEQSIIFTSLPKVKQLYPRNGMDSTVIPITGYVKSPKADSIYLYQYRNFLRYKRISYPLVFSDSEAAFSFFEKIKAETAEYRFVVGLHNKDGWDSVIADRDSIVSGDVIFICGQSNSIFGSSTETFRNEYCRTFGNNMGQSGDTSWVMSDVSGSGGGPDVCEWGLTLQKSILYTYHIPTVIINGGVGGTQIELHQRNSVDPENLRTIYGNMLYRAKRSGLDTVAPMMFWYQGESNQPTNYYNNFKALYNSWKGDYPNLRKFYVIQIHPGCSQPGAAELRELLRTMPDSLAHIQGYCPDGAPGHDGCHYTLGNGYQVIGSQLFSILNRDFYNTPDTAGIESPNLSTAFYTDSTHSSVTLIFKPAGTIVRIPSDTIVNGITESVKDYFYFDNDTSVVSSITASHDTVTLKLKSPLSAKTISYLPDQYYNATATTYEGPWLSSQRGVGAFSFWHVPVLEPSQVGFVNDQRQSQRIVATVISKKLHLNVNEHAHIVISVYNELGQEMTKLADKEFTVGNYEFPLQQLSGAYFLRINTPSESQLIKVIL